MSVSANPFKITILVVLSVSLVFMVSPSTAQRTRSPRPAPAPAVVQGVPFPHWSPFGPRQNNLIYKIYPDTATMLADFDAGLIDITDVPDLVGRTNCGTNPNCDPGNANYYVTNLQVELAEQQLDISHQVSFLGLAMQCGRYTLPAAGSPALCSPGFLPKPPTITINADTVTACDGFHFQLVVHLKNFEENLAVISDPNEVITATPVAGVASSRQSMTGIYDLGCLSGIPPGYVVSTVVYGDAAAPTSHSAKVNIATSAGGTGPVCVNNKVCDVDFNVDYNSASTKEPSVASIHIGRALQHLVDKPNFRNISVLQGAAVCDDIWASPSQGIMASVGDPTTACSATNVGGSPSVEVTSATIAAECALDLSAGAGRPAGFSAIAPCTPVSLYNLASDNIAGAPACAMNGVGSQIPTPACFPSQGNLGPVVILPELGYSGAADLTAACDQLLLGGLTIVPAGATCVDVAAGNVVAGVTAHLGNNGQRISLYVRSPGNFPAITRFGQIVGDEMNFLLGTGAPAGGTICYGGLLPTPGVGAACTVVDNKPHYYSVGQVSPIVLQSAATWNLYTGGQSHGSAPDTPSYGLHSQFASATCGGAAVVFPINYDQYCDPMVDTQATAGESSPSFAASLTFFQNTAALGVTRGALAPMLSQVNQYVALNAWNTETLPGSPSSLVPSYGQGFGAAGPGSYYSLLNMQPNGLRAGAPYQAGGGTSGLVRRSLSSTIQSQNPFTSKSPMEAEIMGEIYDTMLKVNPDTAASNLQIIDWMTKSHSSSFDPTTGLNTQVWNLRNDLCWQDSSLPSVGTPCDKPVTADDVCFTILVQRDGAGLGKIAVQDVMSCTYPDAKTVVVVHSRLGVFQDLNLGALLILPAHIWGTACNWASGPHDSANEPAAVNGAPCTQPSFDPVAVTFNGAPFPTPLPPNVSGMVLGSGPMMCIDLRDSTKIGGHCAVENDGITLAPTQFLDSGYHETLSRFLSFTRCCPNVQGTNLQVLSWADGNKDGRVNILDLSSVVFASGFSSVYWDHPQYGVPGVVSTSDVMIVQFYFDHGLISPCVALSCPGPPSEPTPAAPLVGIDPAIDPFRAGNLYYFGTTRATGGINVNIGNFGGATITGTVTANLGGPPVITPFSIPPNSKGHVSFATPVVLNVGVTMTLSTGESLSFGVPVWKSSLMTYSQATLDSFVSDWADWNNDGFVTIPDAGQVSSCFDHLTTETGSCSGFSGDSTAGYWDLNGNGSVDISDAAFLASAFSVNQAAYPIPDGPDFSPHLGAAAPVGHIDPWWNCSMFPLQRLVSLCSSLK